MTRVNMLSAADKLFEAWLDRDHADNAARGPLVLGPLGHMNMTGVMDAPAQAYSRYNPRFISALEPGIRSLVVALVERFDCVTYTSCEGHATADGQAISCLRNVGVICRNEEERQLLRQQLRQLISRLPQERLDVRLCVTNDKIECENATRLGLELIFDEDGLAPSEYFKQCDALTRDFVDLLCEI